MINLISLRDLVLYNAGPCVNFMAVRYLTSKMKDVTHLPALGPSPGLLKYWKMSSQSAADWEVYTEEFLREMESASAQTALKTVEELDKAGLTVNLMCYCTDSTHCHRSLLADILQERGVEVNLK